MDKQPLTKAMQLLEKARVYTEATAQSINKAASSLGLDQVKPIHPDLPNEWDLGRGKSKDTSELG